MHESIRSEYEDKEGRFVAYWAKQTELSEVNRIKNYS